MKIITPKTYLLTSFGTPIIYFFGSIALVLIIDAIEWYPVGMAKTYIVSFFILPILFVAYGLILLKKAGYKDEYIITGLIFTIISTVYAFIFFINACGPCF